MMMHPIGQRILTEQPLVNLDSIHVEKLQALPTNTFGYAYAQFLAEHEFNPNDRAPIQNQHVFASLSAHKGKELSYILLRYRQCHDFYHVMTDLPPSIPGELALKYVELFQTGLPVCALSATVGSWKLDAAHRQIWTDLYLPWAIRVGKRNQGGADVHTLFDDNADNAKEQQKRETDLWMLNVYWEEEFECDLDELRARLGVVVAPRMES
jgi:ubiquinone biosynthesis protein COQ4